MAGNRFFVRNDALVSLVAATNTTVLQIISPSNIKVKIASLGIFFDGVSVTATPVTVTLRRQTTAGTSSSVTPNALNDNESTTIQTTAFGTFTVEPSYGAIIDEFLIHPQQGFKQFYPMDWERWTSNGGRVGVVVNAPQAVDCRAVMDCEE